MSTLTLTIDITPEGAELRAATRREPDTTTAFRPTPLEGPDGTGGDAPERADLDVAFEPLPLADLGFLTGTTLFDVAPSAQAEAPRPKDDF